MTHTHAFTEINHWHSGYKKLIVATCQTFAWQVLEVAYI